MALRLNLKKILTDKCDILAPKQATDDAGQKSGGLDLGAPLAIDLPCRLIPIKGARENTTETRLNVTRFNVFIMPWTGPDGEEITEHLWLRVFQKVGGQWVGGRFYNVVSAPPSLMEGAPIELTVEEVRP